eukprot:GILK01000646.1.p1 GENE.GILK01000646.1~~GILK01000646.1.p1  ORF type:complete len:914 (+),score=150.90 GILK01000646.1:2378-5119(+)
MFQEPALTLRYVHSSDTPEVERKQEVTHLLHTQNNAEYMGSAVRTVGKMALVRACVVAFVALIFATEVLAGKTTFTREQVPKGAKVAWNVFKDHDGKGKGESHGVLVLIPETSAVLGKKVDLSLQHADMQSAPAYKLFWLKRKSADVFYEAKEIALSDLVEVKSTRNLPFERKLGQKRDVDLRANKGLNGKTASCLLLTHKTGTWTKTAWYKRSPLKTRTFCFDQGNVPDSNTEREEWATELSKFIYKKAKFQQKGAQKWGAGMVRYKSRWGVAFKDVYIKIRPHGEPYIARYSKPFEDGTPAMPDGFLPLWSVNPNSVGAVEEEKGFFRKNPIYCVKVEALTKSWRFCLKEKEEAEQWKEWLGQAVEKDEHDLYNPKQCVPAKNIEKNLCFRDKCIENPMNPCPEGTQCACNSASWKYVAILFLGAFFGGLIGFGIGFGMFLGFHGAVPLGWGGIIAGFAIAGLIVGHLSAKNIPSCQCKVAICRYDKVTQACVMDSASAMAPQNELWFVPPPNMKCVPRKFMPRSCKLTTCSKRDKTAKLVLASPVSVDDLQWQYPGKVGSGEKGQFNCQPVPTRFMSPGDRIRIRDQFSLFKRDKEVMRVIDIELHELQTQLSAVRGMERDLRRNLKQIQSATVEQLAEQDPTAVQITSLTTAPVSIDSRVDKFEAALKRAERSVNRAEDHDLELSKMELQDTLANLRALAAGLTLQRSLLAESLDSQKTYLTSLESLAKFDSASEQLDIHPHITALMEKEQEELNRQVSELEQEVEGLRKKKAEHEDEVEALESAKAEVEQSIQGLMLEAQSMEKPAASSTKMLETESLKQKIQKLNSLIHDLESSPSDVTESAPASAPLDDVEQTKLKRLLDQCMKAGQPDSLLRNYRGCVPCGHWFAANQPLTEYYRTKYPLPTTPQ